MSCSHRSFPTASPVKLLVALVALAALTPLAACVGVDGHANWHSSDGKGGRISVRGAPVEVKETDVIPGDVVVVGGRATVDGEVKGNLVVMGGTLRVGPKARIRGDLVSLGNRVSRVDSSAQIRGSRVEVDHGLINILVDNVLWAMANPGAVVLTACAGLLVFLLLGYLLLVRRYDSDRFHGTVSHRPVRAAILGLLVFVVLHVLAVASFFAAWGMGLAIAIGLMAALLHLVGWLAAANYLGQTLARRAGWKLSGSVAFLMGVGAGLLVFIVPVLGQIAWVVGTWIGVGALLDPMARADLPVPTEPAAPAPPPGPSAVAA